MHPHLAAAKSAPVFAMRSDQRRFRRLLWVACVIGAMLGLAPPAVGFTFQHDPECPGATDGVTAIARFSPITDGPIEPSPLSVVRTGSTTVIVAAVRAPQIDGFPSILSVAIGALPLGPNRIELRTRARAADGSLGPEVVAAALQLTVEAVARPCTPASVIAPVFLETRVDAPFEPIVVRVLDAQGLPVANAEVTVTRLVRPEEESRTGFAGSVPEASLSGTPAITDGAGTATFAATANSVRGTYQVRIIARSALRSVQAYITLSNRDDAISGPVVPVVEYTGHKKFYTSNPAEMKILDGTPGWVRSGAVFLAFPPMSVGVPGPRKPVCRYMGLPEPAPYSHFFSADTDECAEVGARYPDVWLLESDAVFSVLAPAQASGACPDETVPLYRMFATSFDGVRGPSHVFTTSLFLQQWLTTPGLWPHYIAEGVGPGVAMCVLP